MGDYQFLCARCITIGDGVPMVDNVFITNNFHGRSEKKELIMSPADRELYIMGEVHIEDSYGFGEICALCRE